MKQSSLKEPGQVQSINGFTKEDIDLVNKYSMRFGYKPDFKNNVIYDADRCCKAFMVKDGNAIYTIRDGIKENLTENANFHSALKITFKNKGWNKIFDKGIRDVFGLVSLKHSEL